MKQEVKDQWVAALKSGQYVKAKGNLKKGSTYFCCLGVLCDLASKNGVGEWMGNTFVAGSETQDAVLPFEVVEWAGLPTKKEGTSANSPALGSNPDISPRKMPNSGGYSFLLSSLAELNDYTDLSLPEIGEVIEKEFACTT